MHKWQALVHDIAPGTKGAKMVVELAVAPEASILVVLTPGKFETTMLDYGDQQVLERPNDMDILVRER